MRGLLIIPRPGDHYREDFAIIVRHLGEIDPGLRVRVVHEEEPVADLIDTFRGLPTLTVSFRHHVSVPLPGRVFSCRYIPKPRQVHAYLRAGLPFPRSRLFQWGLELDPGLWGPFVVMKPISPGTMSHGNVQFVPTGFVSRLRPGHFVPEHPIHEGPMLVQAFIDTGEHPASNRVLTLFGEPLYAMEIRLRQPRPLLSSPLDALLAAKVASNGGPRDRVMIDDYEILAFARRMWRALPDVPLQALDILKERTTGRLLAIESNPGGNTWHFSSRNGAGMRDDMGDGRRIMLSQFNALERAAQALAQAARRHAA